MWHISVAIWMQKRMGVKQSSIHYYWLTNQFHICLIFFVDCFRLLTDGNGPDYGYTNNYGDDNVYDYGNGNGYGDYSGYGRDNGYGNVYLFQ